MNLNAALVALATPEKNKMKRTFIISLVTVLFLSACHTAKNAQRSVAANQVVNQSPATTIKPVDSIDIIKQQLTNLLNTPLSFTTFYGKAKADFESDQFSGNVTIYVRMQKDSIIWISVTGPLNIEGARVLITTDSVKVIDKIHGTVEIHSINQLQKLIKLPLSFNDFQNVILGKPYLPGNSNASYDIRPDSIKVSAQQAMINYIFSFARSSLVLGESSFSASSNGNAINANIFYNGYQLTDGINFSADRNIAVSGTASIKLDLNFKEYNFNQPQTYPFTISKNYTLKYD